MIRAHSAYIEESCPIICLYVLNSVLWCPLRFQHKNYVWFLFTYSCLCGVSYLIYVICVCLWGVSCLFLRYLCLLTDSGVQQISCCLFLFLFFFLLRLDCSFLITLSVFSNVYLLSKNILFIENVNIRYDVIIENVNIRYDVILKRFGEFCLLVTFFTFFCTLQNNMISLFHKEGISRNAMTFANLHI